MNARTAARAEVLAPHAEAQKHNRVLLHALQTAHPVMHLGRQQFIQGLTFTMVGGNIDATVYLAGQPAPVKAAEISLRELTP